VNSGKEGKFFLNGLRMAGIIVGVLFVLSGGIFALQGEGVLLGSPMSDNPTWIYIGSLVILMGVILILISSIAFKKKSSARKSDTAATSSTLENKA
jgi:hypothetical protein